MKKSAIEQMVEWLENALVEAKRDVKENRQFGVNSAGFNAYLGRMEMVEQMLDEARHLLSEEKAEQKQAKPKAPSGDEGYWWCPECEEKSEYVEVHYCGSGLEFRPSPKPSESELVSEIRAYMKNVAMFKADYEAIEEILSKHTKEQI